MRNEQNLVLFETECGHIQDTYRRLLNGHQKMNPAKLAVQVVAARVVVGHCGRRPEVSCQQRPYSSQITVMDVPILKHADHEKLGH